MNENEFKNGDKVFTVHGQEATYIGPLPDGSHCIVPIYEMDDDSFAGEPTTVNVLFSDPPGVSMPAEIQRLRDEIDKAQAELDAIRERIAEEKDARLTFLNRITQHEGLENLDKLLAGRITHVVHVNGYGIPIVKNAIDIKDCYGTQTLHLLSFVPSQKYPTGNTFWSFSLDDRDAKTKTIPCVSLEDATVKAKALMDGVFARFRQGDKLDMYFLAEVHKACVALGHEMPHDLLDRMLRNRIDRAAKEYESAKNDAERKLTAVHDANEQLRLAVERRAKETT